MSEYAEFIESKLKTPPPRGIEIDSNQLNPHLFPFQRKITEWALHLGRAAIFAECGLGKTICQLAWAEQIVMATGKSVLILTPLAVTRQTVEEARKFAIRVPVTLAASQDDVTGPGIVISNYQKLSKFETDSFAGIVLDESSILKDFVGKTKQALCQAFAHTPYRLCCTATPAPNDWIELCNHADFLGIMPSAEILSRWFINDTMKAGGYRLKGHAEADFWRWIASWAACLSKPSDLGFSDEGYALPPLQIIEVMAETKLGEASDRLFDAEKMTATSLHRVMRRTARDRAETAAKFVAKCTGPVVVWCNTDYEEDELRELIPDAVCVSGKDKDSVKERNLDAFTQGIARVIITKPSIAGYGLNWQHCADHVFVGLNYSYESLHQAIRRSYRFGQSKPVHCYLVQTVEEGDVQKAVALKKEQHERMVGAMVAAASKYWREDADARSLRIIDSKDVIRGQDWSILMGDCVERTKEIASESVHLSVFSPPFSTLYIYSDSIRDMGNNENDEAFFRHFRFLLPELMRILIPGRIVAVHCKDLPLYRGRDGEAGLSDFPGELIREFTQAGFTFHSRVTIWKCPVTERERTNNNGLLHKTVMRDSSQIRQGMADYMLMFRKPPREGSNLSDIPIERATGFTGYVGDPEQSPFVSEFHPSPYARKKPLKDPSVRVWQRYAEPVWWDIDQTDVLNYELAREQSDERHICPLQLGVIERCVELWSQPGETVFSPFGGIGSEGYVALKMKRKAILTELKESYVQIAAKNLRIAEEQSRQVGLFDFAE